jgi:hypothetical protein
MVLGDAKCSIDEMKAALVGIFGPRCIAGQSWTNSIDGLHYITNGLHRTAWEISGPQ